MNNLSKDFELLLGHAAFKLWPPRDMQEKLFEAAVPNNPLLRYSVAVFLPPSSENCTPAQADQLGGDVRNVDSGH